MFTQNEYVAIQINHDARDRAFQEAENLRKLRQLGLPKTNLAVQAAGTLGRLMITFGQRLTQIEAASRAVTAPAGSAD